jgi:hypothetical protein
MKLFSKWRNNDPETFLVVSTLQIRKKKGSFAYNPSYLSIKTEFMKIKRKRLRRVQGKYYN